MKWHDRASTPGRLLAAPTEAKARKPKYVRLLMDAMQFFEDPRGITIPWFVRYCHVMRSVPLEQSLRLAQRVLSHGISTGVVAKHHQYVFLVEHPASAAAAAASAAVKRTGAALGTGGGGGVARLRPVMKEERSERVPKRHSRVHLSPPRRRHRSRSRERHCHHHHHHHRSHRLRR